MTAAAVQPPPRPATRYAAIERTLADAIGSGTLPPGAILTEEPIARLFGTSRTPVRTALGELEARGLLARFDGRGFVVPGADAPQKLTLTRGILGLGEGDPQRDRAATSERIARDFEAVVSRALPFGLFRIHEQGAADHYDVSRTVVRELLSRFKDRGLVRKDLRSHWVVGPLTARDVGDYFAIRGKLEPLALRDAAPHTPSAVIAMMLASTKEACDAGAALAPGRIAELERDLHVRLLSRSTNPHLLRMIHQSQIALMVNRVFAEKVGARPFMMALREHSIVLEFLTRNAPDAAAGALEEHLRLSAARTRQRLMAISVFPPPDLPDFLRPEAP